MKVRIKFTKQGEMRFIGHLDFMRFFQKVLRRADIDIRFSEGISPHMIMSFASPLGVGVSSEGDYVDIEVGTPLSTQEALRRLNESSVEGVRFLDFRQIPEGKAGKAMSLVAAADYEISFRDGYEPEGDWPERFRSFLAQEKIEVTREKKKAVKKAAGKKGRTNRKSEAQGEGAEGAPGADVTETLDIRPLIYAFEGGKRMIRLRLSSGSAANLRPDLVMKAFMAFCGSELPPYALAVNRTELLARDPSGEGFVTLQALGECIEGDVRP